MRRIDLAKLGQRIDPAVKTVVNQIGEGYTSGLRIDPG